MPQWAVMGGRASRADFIRGVVANREDEVEMRRAGGSEFVQDLLRRPSTFMPAD